MVGVGGYGYFLGVGVVRPVSLPDNFLAGVRKKPVSIAIEKTDRVLNPVS